MKLHAHEVILYEIVHCFTIFPKEIEIYFIESWHIATFFSLSNAIEF